MPHADDVTPDLPTAELPVEPTAEPTVEPTVETTAVTDGEPGVSGRRPRRWVRRDGRRRRLPAVLAITLGATVAGGGVAAVVDAHSTVLLDVHGEVAEVGTFARSVADLLESHEIVLGDHDSVTPALDLPLRDGAEIVVRRASEVVVEADGEQETVWVAALDADDALRQLASIQRDVRLVPSRTEGRPELPLPLSAPGEPVAVVVDGETHELTYEGTGLGTLLEGAGVEVADVDLVSVVGSQGLDAAEDTEAGASPEAAEAPADEEGAEDAEAPEGAEDADAPDAEAGEPAAAVTVVIQRVVTQDETTTTALPYTRTERRDPDRFSDLGARVEQQGAEGVRTVVERVTTIDGVETERVLVSEDEVAPVDEVVVIGTRARPAPRPAPAPAPAPAPSGSGVSEDVWVRLAQCESGGRPDVVSASGRFHGLYQFSVATWRSVGGQGLPSQASPAEQRKRAEILQARSGWGQWPACSRRLGLR